MTRLVSFNCECIYYIDPEHIRLSLDDENGELLLGLYGGDRQSRNIVLDIDRATQLRDALDKYISEFGHE